MNHVDIPTYVEQMRTVLNHYREQKEKGMCQAAKRCNINFMSKGDAMANKYVIKEYPKLWMEMDKVCKEYDLEAKANLSTIMPYTIKDRNLIDIFRDQPVYLYYSLYSMNSQFRKVWLPNAISAEVALDKLKAFQEIHNRVITFHFTLIKGHNDNMKDIRQMAKELEIRNFNGKLNLVRFNPHPTVSDVESEPEKIQEVFDLLSSIFNNPKSYIVPRLDVNTKTPCGMFVPLSEVHRTN
jgi:adenine C2-methylase RlmN of 23S rRNA A2503 and tRNA A37